jgi:Flp pilus assembly pilin Flp
MLPAERKDAMPSRPDDRGAVSTEYALLAVFIAVAVVVGITLLGSAVDHLFNLGNHAVAGNGE